MSRCASALRMLARAVGHRRSAPNPAAAVVLAALALAMLPHAAASEADILVLEGATLHDGAGNTVPEAVIVVVGERIAHVGRERPAGLPADARSIDLAGKFVVPGLVDAHVHLGQTGFFDARPDYVDLGATYPYAEVLAAQKRSSQRYHRAYLGSGITTIYDVGGAAWTLELQHASGSGADGPRIAATGPMLTPAPPEAIARFNAPFEKIMVSLDDPTVRRHFLPHARALGAAGTKLWGMPAAGRMQELEALVAELHEAGGWLLVHATAQEDARRAIVAGAKVLVHSVEDAAVDAAFVALARREGVVYIPTLTVHRAIHRATRALLGEALPVADPRRLLDARTVGLFASAPRVVDEALRAQLRTRVEDDEVRLAARERTMRENLRRLHAAGVTVAAGTDAGNPGQLHGLSLVEELEAMQRAGIEAADLVVIATANGARALGRHDDLGRVAEGMLADLLVLDRDPAQDIGHLRSVRAVAKGGRWVYRLPD